MASEIDHTCISKFNISRSFVWEGAKRALARKSFSAKNKISVKFTDDVGTSEGAVDMGGPMKEFFTLVIQWMLTSQLFCGPEHHKFLSFQSSCLEGNDYYFAGMLIAMSLVHGGSGPQCFAHNMFEALLRDPEKIAITIEDVYDMELQLSLQKLYNAGSKEEAIQVINSTSVPHSTPEHRRHKEDCRNDSKVVCHWTCLTGPGKLPNWSVNAWGS